MKVFKRILLALILLGGVGAGAAYYAWYPTSQNGPSFRTSPIERGDLLSTITATGTVEPEEVVDVGAQIMGRIVEFGPDPKDPTKFVDYGSTVEEGTVLAKIDPTPYEASLEQAEAALQRAKAELLQLEAKYEQAEKEWKRAELLRTKNAIAETDYDTIVANYKAAKANLEVGKASVRQNEAAVRVAKTNLGYTTIVSPVRGVILDRRVNIGQTVVASLNAPSLFLIAKDLRR
ncbi:MAG TPA: efflux RND transporter periplasmic adaptor subunit, partial [Thermoguttaceae bacterium]|nr:efflux RND transporter periplasmic adaptor subunit [Thermoguttaceae bacterium]